MIIKLKIKEIRKQKKISLNELSENTGISKSRLSNLENNENAIDKMLLIEAILIADNLGIRISELYERTHIEIKGIGEF